MTEKILIISGATACGKSELALQLGQQIDIEIINADSLQIYQGLPILSSQPSATDQTKIKHHLYSYLEYNKNCSVGLWLEFVKPIVEKIWLSNKLPVFVGGSGLYISKLIDGIAEIPTIDIENKRMAQKLYDELGHHEFMKKYGEEKITDKNRLIRACEVFLQTQKSIFFWHDKPAKKIFPQAKIFHFNLNPKREDIYKNCNLRFSKMLASGAIKEVKNLVSLGVNDNMNITKTLGFEEIRNYLKNKISHEKLHEIASKKTRNYAKRQLTWFRHQFNEIIFFENSHEFLKQLAKYEIQ